MSSVIFQPYRKRMLPLFLFRTETSEELHPERLKKLKELSRHRGIKSGLTFDSLTFQRFQRLTL